MKKMGPSSRIQQQTEKDEWDEERGREGRTDERKPPDG
jgi:hypothetical protein